MLKGAIITSSPEETQQFGAILASQLTEFYGHQPVVFALRGELGAGKTQFVKGLASGLGITKLITSPSYTLVNEYTFELDGQTVPFVHLDAWRLPKLTDLESVGWSRFLASQAVIALEWAPNRPAEVLSQNITQIVIDFAYGKPKDERQLNWTSNVELNFDSIIEDTNLSAKFIPEGEKL